MQLRPYQTDGINLVKQSIATVKVGGKGNKRVVLALATGGGKSLICESIISGALARGRRVMFVVNRVQLAEQMSAHLDCARIDHGLLQGANSRATYEPCLISSIDTIHRRGYPEVDLVLMDEAHACAGNSKYHKMLEHYKDIPCIGVTATWWAKGLGKTYPWGTLFEDIVCPISIPELIEQKYLVDVDIYAPSEPDLSAVHIVAGDYNEKELGEAVDKPELIGDIVLHWKKLALNKKTIAFATNIAHSKHIASEFLKNNVSAEHIDYTMQQEEKTAILKRFKRNEFTVLCNCALLSEGFDDPETECMILARPTRSLIRFIQMAGRVLRPFAGKEKALLLDHSGSSKLLGSPTEAQPVELDDGKPKKSAGGEKKEKKEILLKPCASCSYMKKVHKCPVCGFAPEKQNTIETGEGELVLVGKGKKALKTDDKRKLFAELKHIAQSRGWSTGRLSNVFRDIAGTWPNAYKEEKPIAPTEATLRMVQHLHIKFAKSQGANRAAA